MNINDSFLHARYPYMTRVNIDNSQDGHIDHSMKIAVDIDHSLAVDIDNSVR